MEIVKTTQVIEKYMTKPIVVEALKFDGENLEQVKAFAPEVDFSNPDELKGVVVARDSKGMVYFFSEIDFNSGFDKLS